MLCVMMAVSIFALKQALCHLPNIAATVNQVTIVGSLWIQKHGLALR